VAKLSLMRSSLEGCNGVVGVKAVGERSNNGSRTMGFNSMNQNFDGSVFCSSRTTE
jgi:hypothetical protein